MAFSDRKQVQSDLDGENLTGMDYAKKAIQSVQNSVQSFCKFLSANDTGATRSNQSGILVSKSALEMMFNRQELDVSGIPKRTVKIRWQDDFFTESCFTYYKSKNELRITRFGRGFPFLKPDQTGDLFVFTKQSDLDYSGYFLETDEEIEEFLNTLNISPTETNSLIHTDHISSQVKEKLAVQEFISRLNVDFPASDVMSEAAREIEEKAYGHRAGAADDPDQKLIRWTDMEYTLFRELECVRYGKVIEKGFQSVDEFIKLANVVLNRRKSRAGKSLEHHLAAIFDRNGIEYASQAVTEGKKKPDFLFPSLEAYQDINFSTDYIVSLAAKTTCKDRWRQVLNEADRLRDKPKYLCTLQQGISKVQMDEMQAEHVILVVPKPYISAYPIDCRDRIWTISRFVQYIKIIEGN